MPHCTANTNLRNVCLSLVLFTFLLALPSYAQFTPSDDAYVNASSPSTNDFTPATLNVSNGSAQLPYIRFNLSAVPSRYTGTQVAKASLKLFVNGVVFQQLRDSDL